MFLILLILVAASTFWLLHFLLDSGAALKLAADLPNQRSLHTKVIPRIGGITVVPVAMGAAIIADPTDWQLPTIAIFLSLGSFWDDRMNLPVGLRFAAHMLAALALVVGLPHMEIAAAGLCWFLIVWMTNLYNFMDGSDGLIGGVSAIGFCTYSYVAWPSLPGLAMLALFVVFAVCVFLWFNFPPARVFMGDSGSIPLGFLAGGAGVVGWHLGTWTWWFPVLVFSPLIVDASITLLQRILQRKKFWQAHRGHYYQRLILMGWSHRRLALIEYCFMAAVSLIALALLSASLMIQYLGLTMVVVTYCIVMLLVDMRWKAFKRSM